MKLQIVYPREPPRKLQFIIISMPPPQPLHGMSRGPCARLKCLLESALSSVTWRLPVVNLLPQLALWLLRKVVSCTDALWCMCRKHKQYERRSYPLPYPPLRTSSPAGALSPPLPRSLTGYRPQTPQQVWQSQCWLPTAYRTLHSNTCGIEGWVAHVCSLVTGQNWHSCLGVGFG